MLLLAQGEHRNGRLAGQHAETAVFLNIPSTDFDAYDIAFFYCCTAFGKRLSHLHPHRCGRQRARAVLVVHAGDIGDFVADFRFAVTGRQVCRQKQQAGGRVVFIADNA